VSSIVSGESAAFDVVVVVFVVVVVVVEHAVNETTDRANRRCVIFI
jgi:hypothetical protein